KRSLKRFTIFVRDGIWRVRQGGAGADGWRSHPDPLGWPTSESSPGVPPNDPAIGQAATSGQARETEKESDDLVRTTPDPATRRVYRSRPNPCLCSGAAASPRASPRTRDDGEQRASLARRGTDDFGLTEEEIRLLAQVAAGATADVAARKLELCARTLRRRLRAICDRLEVNTPIEAVVWAARRQLI